MDEEDDDDEKLDLINTEILDLTTKNEVLKDDLKNIAYQVS